MSQSSKNREQEAYSRRGFIRTASTAMALGAGIGGTSLVANSAQAREGVGQFPPRAFDAYELRRQAAQIHLRYSTGLSVQETNGDDDRYANENYYASFTKTMEHDSLGDVNPQAYEALLAAVASGDPADFDAIPLDSSSVFSLANPQGAFRFVFSGLDGHATRMAPAPSFRSATTAAEMGELYWLALTRDVPFSAYASSRIVAAACHDLNSFSETVGPTNSEGKVTAGTVFRGDTVGDLTGPYVSQFLWKNVNYGPTLIEQRYLAPQPGSDFMTEEAEWLNILTGGQPMDGAVFETTRKYIYNNRSLAEYVHGDVLFQAYFNALLIALSYGPDALDEGNPYRDTITNQGGFTSLGGPWMIDLVTQAGNLALAGAWYQKWIAHRRLRPEVFGGRIQNHKLNRRSYEIHPDILNCECIDRVFDATGTYQLPMAYPEGSPTHPAYPAGHACVAGACATVLKAVCNEGFIIPDPVVASRDGTALNPYSGSALTLGNEFNKLANNVSLGRDAAGVHYRSDGSEGILVGEQQALALLQDYSLALNEQFGGFHLTKFDGTPVVVINGRILDA